MRSVTLEEFLASAEGISGYISVITTDQCLLVRWPLEKDVQWEPDEEKIIELRIFNDRIEKKLNRSGCDGKLYERVVCDDETSLKEGWISYKDYFDQEQYLDSKRKGTKSNSKLKVRYYFSRDKFTGRAYVKDWRIVGVEGGL